MKIQVVLKIIDHVKNGVGCLLAKTCIGKDVVVLSWSEKRVICMYLMIGMEQIAFKNHIGTKMVYNVKLHG